MHVFDCWCSMAYSYIGEQVSEGSRRPKDKTLKRGCRIVVQLSKNVSSRNKSQRRLARKEKNSLALQSFTTDLDVNVLRKRREQELQDAALRPLLTGQGHRYSINPSEL